MLVVAAQEGRQDRLDLQQRKRVPHALVSTTTKRNVGVVALVLLARWRKAVRIECHRIAKHLGNAVRHRRRDQQPGAGRQRVLLELEVTQGHAQEHEQRRVQAQRLLDRPLGAVELAQREEVHVVAGVVDAMQLVDDALHVLGLAEQLE